MKKDLIYRGFKATTILIGLAFMIYGCEQNSAQSDHVRTSFEKNVKDSVVYLPPVKEVRPVICYQVDSLHSPRIVDSLKLKLAKQEQATIAAINRIDLWRLKIGKKVVIPDTLTPNLLDYSPFPYEMKIFDSIPKTVLISQRIQGFALYERSQLVRWGPVSTGKMSTPTPNGLHYGNYKAKRKISTVDSDWIMPYYFNFMNFYGVGVHEYGMPGFPASHACVRLFQEDARFIYDWAEQWQLDRKGQVVERNGTPFMVFGEFDYEGKLPWLKLAENSEHNNLSGAEMDTLRSYVNNYFKDKRNFPKPQDLQGVHIAVPVDGIDTFR
ncbi:L,D-transpeptidase [Salinimicrobium flavum]|uniref:L,D-transpeptidase n=1 Tax=Salinimicrobium flavum TaxID=1737065 RepID=A0ABW5J345_9FLAO